MKTENGRGQRNYKMRGGVGGPLLCVGDLLSDLEISDMVSPDGMEGSSTCNTGNSIDLTTQFQETYDRLNQALAATDHSWTALTLKLCGALEAANKLIQSTNTNAGLLSEKVLELEIIIKRGASAVSAAKALHLCQIPK